MKKKNYPKIANIHKGEKISKLIRKHVFQQQNEKKKASLSSFDLVFSDSGLNSEIGC